MLIQNILTNDLAFVNQFVVWVGAFIMILSLYELYGGIRSYFTKHTDQKNAEESVKKQHQATSVINISLVLIMFGIATPLALITWKIYTKMSR